MTKKQRTIEIINRLKAEYPDADCTLDYREAWKLLVSVRLAAQCTDARVNVVVKGLFEKYPDVEALAAADVADIEAIVKPCAMESPSPEPSVERALSPRVKRSRISSFVKVISYEEIFLIVITACFSSFSSVK